MRALIRSENEIVKESDGIEGIDWTTGYPLTSPEWEGGRPYRLVDNYTEYDNGETTFEDPAVPLETVPGTDETGDPDDEVVELNGKRYTKAELRLLLG